MDPSVLVGVLVGVGVQSETHRVGWTLPPSIYVISSASAPELVASATEYCHLAWNLYSYEYEYEYSLSSSEGKGRPFLS